MFILIRRCVLQYVASVGNMCMVILYELHVILIDVELILIESSTCVYDVNFAWWIALFVICVVWVDVHIPRSVYHTCLYHQLNSKQYVKKKKFEAIEHCINLHGLLLHVHYKLYSVASYSLQCQCKFKKMSTPTICNVIASCSKLQ